MSEDGIKINTIHERKEHVDSACRTVTAAESRVAADWNSHDEHSLHFVAGYAKYISEYSGDLTLKKSILMGINQS